LIITTEKAEKNLLEYDARCKYIPIRSASESYSDGLIPKGILFLCLINIYKAFIHAV